jgi:hypothetical protein|tara:strand:- start:114 stop:368 length:255 start_codon:yes stop_codon:yes gene_type:complete
MVEIVNLTLSKNMAEALKRHTVENKLWVFDTQQYLEIYAPTIEDALKQVGEVEKASGLEFTQAPEWENYQEEYAETTRNFGGEK